MNSTENEYCSAFSWSGITRVLVLQDTVRQGNGWKVGAPPQWKEAGSSSLTQAVKSSTPSGLSGYSCGRCLCHHLLPYYQTFSPPSMAGSPASVGTCWHHSDLLQGLKVFGTHVAVVLPVSFLLPSNLSVVFYLFSSNSAVSYSFIKQECGAEVRRINACPRHYSLYNKNIQYFFPLQ